MTWSRAGIVLVAAVAASLVAMPARAAAPDRAGVAPDRASVAWTGELDPRRNHVCTDVLVPACDRFFLTVHGDDARAAVLVSVAADRHGDDIDLFVYNERGYLVTSATAGGDRELVMLGGHRARYRIEVRGLTVPPGASYRGRATWSSGAVGPVDRERDCAEDLPAAAAPLGEGRRAVDVHVLLDGVAAADARRVMTTAATAFTRIGVDLVGHGFEPVAIRADAGSGRATIDGVFQAAKAHVGGARPGHADVVYVMTRKQLVSGGRARTPVGGAADCIGGVRFPERAFAVGRVVRPFELRPGAPRLYVDGTAVVAAHEIGHLLGAHHHYANCAEAAPHLRPRDLSAACTLMVNVGDVASLRFSTVNASIVFGHADAFAR